ncbi:WD40 repeat domain-containing serine/threonine protein kinase [Paludisphaera borealis]|uniref:Serine/threonine-protein kinase PknB n=1 Tax=Paludisphaera borealis TaxID=1387353 RepID=A0A1U7CK80_9BACT|nr:serine/threonine-protein kinase [Paludisphaera borealis]APW59293.1 Serine/threonine-protein kinase PknB [Paludisphaera borealis]
MARRDPTDLILGLRALRERLIAEHDLITAFTLWEADEGRSLGEILVSQGSLDAPTLDRLQEPTGGGEDSSATVAYTGPSSAGEGRGADEPTMRYRVLGLHSRGGLGEVFTALDMELDRRVALKELQPRFAHDEMSQLRFLQEAEITGRLEHPGVVPVYGLGRHADGRPYYAMRFVEGETFRAAIDRFHRGDPKDIRLEDRELVFRRLLRSVVDACYAVGYAHSRGVVHRDIKPENIMLGKFGETLVVDWGIAKNLTSTAAENVVGSADESLSLRDSPFMTRPGSAIGTPPYMSPEQAWGDNDRIGPASDVYSLGATLYCLLVGHAPFTGESVVEVLGRVRRGVFPSPRRVRRSIDAALETICLKALALRPEDRYESPLEMADELEKWLADVRYRAEQQSAMEQVKDSRARFALERASTFLGRNRVGEGMVWLTRAMEHGTPALERAVRMSLAAWHNRDRLLERTLPQTGSIHALRFSPDGKRLATASREGVVVLWDVASGTHLGAALDHPGPVAALAFSTDGRRIVTGCDDGTVRRWDGMTGEPVGLPLNFGATVVDLQSCGSGFVVVSRTASTLIRDDDEPATDPLPAEGRLIAGAIAPDGSFVAAVTEAGDVWLYEPGERAWRLQPRPHPRGAGSLTVHPRDGRLLVRCVDGVARLCDQRGVAPLLEFADFEETAWSGFSPSGDTIATISTSGDVQLWDSATGAAIGEPLPHRSRLGEVVFHPDGSVLATGCHDGSARLWDAATGLPVGPSLEHAGPVDVLAFSPDGRRLAASCADGRLRFWKTPTPLPGDVERIACWVRVATNLDIDASDAVRPLETLAGWELRRRLYELGGPPLK